MNTTTIEAQRAELLAKGHDALDTIFNSGSHGPFIAEVLIDMQKVMERPGTKVRSGAFSIVFDAKDKNGTDYAAMSAFTGNKIFLASAVQNLADGYQRKIRMEQDADMIAQAFENMRANAKGPEAPEAEAEAGE